MKFLASIFLVFWVFLGHGNAHRSPGIDEGSLRLAETLTLTNGESVIISSSDISPSSHGLIGSWNIQASDSTISAVCKIRLFGECHYSMININGEETCTGYGEQEAVTAEDSMQITFATRLRRQHFKCNITATTTPTSPNGRPWTYYGETGPEHWVEMYPACGGQSQSPINIDSSATIGEYPWKELGLHGYDTAAQELTLFNRNRSAELEVEGSAPYCMGGNLPLNDEFIFGVVIFHWGMEDDMSSEHTVDGQYYALEVQFVHYNSKYGSFPAALGQPDGIYSLSSMYQISADDNEELAPLILALEQITDAGASITFDQFSLLSLLPENYNEIYRYNGSKSDPGCQEDMIRDVCINPVDISSSQLAKFRNLVNETGGFMTTSIRPIQDLNGRTVSEGQETPSWSHHGPDGQDVWASEISESCGGDRQSPIDIVTSTVEYPETEPMVATGFDVLPNSISFQNNDNGAQIQPVFDVAPTIIGGPWLTPYEFFHYHFHWGSPDTDGSEHTIDGKRYAAEIHMLVYNQSLGDFGTAFMTDQGVYEVGIFMDISEEDNPKLEPVITALEQIVPSLSVTDIPPFPMENLLPENLQNFYYYDGSFTAPLPTCSELADFVVFADPVPISQAQLARFFNIENAAGFKIQNNFRDIQPLNGRTVYGSSQANC